MGKPGHRGVGLRPFACSGLDLFYGVDCGRQTIYDSRT